MHTFTFYPITPQLCGQNIFPSDSFGHSEQNVYSQFKTFLDCFLANENFMQNLLLRTSLWFFGPFSLEMDRYGFFRADNDIAYL